MSVSVGPTHLVFAIIYEYTKHILHIRTHDQFAVLSMYVETIESAYLILFNENLCKCGYY